MTITTVVLVLLLVLLLEVVVEVRFDVEEDVTVMMTVTVEVVGGRTVMVEVCVTTICGILESTLAMFLIVKSAMYLQLQCRIRKTEATRS